VALGPQRHEPRVFEASSSTRVEVSALDEARPSGTPGEEGYSIDPSYETVGQIGYDVPCDREQAMIASGDPRAIKGA